MGLTKEESDARKKYIEEMRQKTSWTKEECDDHDDILLKWEEEDRQRMEEEGIGLEWWEKRGSQEKEEK